MMGLINLLGVRLTDERIRVYNAGKIKSKTILH